MRKSYYKESSKIKKITAMVEQQPAQSKTTMILISFFLGGLGIHRLMMGYSNWWLMLITAGGCGIWALVDFISIITGSMKMQDGRDLI
ncbi:MAG TPA: TM2 domain-containing protein [Paludibacteraceae bacterium]|nr:TM2 domain-containing protein [Paludibacteraceae bacterium]